MLPLPATGDHDVIISWNDILRKNMISIIFFRVDNCPAVVIILEQTFAVYFKCYD